MPSTLGSSNDKISTVSLNTYGAIPLGPSLRMHSFHSRQNTHHSRRCKFANGALLGERHTHGAYQAGSRGCQACCNARKRSNVGGHCAVSKRRILYRHTKQGKARLIGSSSRIGPGGLCIQRESNPRHLGSGRGYGRETRQL